MFLGAGGGSAAFSFLQHWSRHYRWPNRHLPKNRRRHCSAIGGEVTRRPQWPQHHKPMRLCGHSAASGYICSGGRIAGGGVSGDSDRGAGGAEGEGAGSGIGKVVADGVMVADATVDAVNVAATHRGGRPSRILLSVDLFTTALHPRKPGRT